MPIKELDKVQLGPSRDGAPESEAEAEVNSDSDQESDVTMEDPDEEREYEVGVWSRLCSLIWLNSCGVRRYQVG